MNVAKRLADEDKAAFESEISAIKAEALRLVNEAIEIVEEESLISKDAKIRGLRRLYADKHELEGRR